MRAIATRGIRMEKSIQVINQMQADKVIEKYAIGGAIGVIF
jgi:hypothetical protein